MFKEITRTQSRLTLHFIQYYECRPVQITIACKEIFRKTPYTYAITYGYLLQGSVELTLNEYYWLLRWKEYICLWTGAFPKTFNFNAMIPAIPPALDKSGLTTNEKRIVKKLKEDVKKRKCKK